MNIKVGDNVRVKEDTHTQGMLEGCEGVVVSIDELKYLPISLLH